MRAFACLLFILVLTGCSQTPTLTHIQSSQQSSLAALTHWKIKGKLAFKSAEDKFSASLNWQQQQQDFQFRLSSFIGTTLLNLSHQQGISQLQADNQTYRDTDPQFLIWRVMGINIPVNDLSQWVKSAAVGGTHATFNPDGTLLNLKQRCNACKAWHIQYSRYRSVQGYTLPHLLTLTQGDNHIKIKINQWTLQ